MSIADALGRDRMRVLLATGTLLLLIAGHAVRETARDALFLADLPATSLPWAYLAIAAGALGLGVANRHLMARFSHRQLLLYTLGLAALVDVAFWHFSQDSLHLDLFALYAWTGIVGTAVTLQLWLHLASIFTVTEAKRAFTWITAGGLAGAVLGSLLAGVLLRAFETRALLLAAALLSLASGAVAMGLSSRDEVGREPEEEEEEERATSLPLREVAGSGYVRRIVLLGAAVAALATGIDFTFKQAIADAIPSERLGDFFAAFYAIMNAAALCFELFVASWLLKRLGVTRTLFILPACLLASSGLFVTAGGFAAALLLKGVDGALRPSLFGASVEVLYQPFSPQARNAARTAAESLGKRGGQALASLLILLVAGSLGAPDAIAWGVVGCAVLALVPLWGLRADYVARFHARLRGFAGEARTGMPKLELHSLEVLVQSLSAPDEGEVLAAIGLLESYGRVRLVSPLILHHPSPRVVLRALDLFRGTSSAHLDALLEHLLEHADAEVRAAALDTIAARDPASPHPERLLRSDPSPVVRTTALVALVARHDRSEDGRAFLAKLVATGSAGERVALARALPRLTREVAGEAADALIALGDAEASGALAHSLASEPMLDSSWIPGLIRLLGLRVARPSARAALLSLGDTALDALAQALSDRCTDASVCRHLPRTIHRFGTARAAQILIRALPDAEPDVRYKILRGLGRMRANDPELPIADDVLANEAQRALTRAVEMFAFRVAYRRAATGHGDPPGEDDLLAAVLADKEQRALERVFRALQIAQPDARFDAIFEALHGSRPAAQAGGLELIENLVSDDRLRAGVLALVGPESEAERLRLAARDHASSRVRALVAAFPELHENEEAAGAPARSVSDWEAVFAPLLADEDPILVSIARDRHDALRSGIRAQMHPHAVRGAR